MNTVPGEPFRENTLDSVFEGFKAGASWIEFDVQVTQDGVPVIWHDDHIVTLSEAGLYIHQEVSEISCAQFMALASNRAIGHRLVRQFAHAESREMLPWHCDDDSRGSPATFVDFLKHSPPELGFDVELKFFKDRPTTFAERQSYLKNVLEVLKEHVGDRRLFFSSFEPDVCIDLRRMQQEYPVFFLTTLQKVHDDARRNTLEAAIEVSQGAELDGIVACADYMLPDLQQNVERAKAAGLMVLTYGNANIEETHIKAQISAGVAAICTDRISAAVNAFTSESFLNHPVLEKKDQTMPKTSTVNC